MGFAVWLDSQTAWAAGTHEYRPMGAAVIAASDLFRIRDFSPLRKPPSRRDPAFAGLFGSLEEVNHFLKQRGRNLKGKSKGAIARARSVI